MADETIKVTDPYQTPVTFVNQVVGIGHLNGVCNVTLAVARFMPMGGDYINPDMVVACRLRLDLFCVQQLHDQLGQILAQNVKATGKAN